MNLKEQISEDIKSALKAGDSFTAGVLRMVVAALQNKSIEKRGKGEGGVAAGRRSKPAGSVRHRGPQPGHIT